MAIKRSTSNEAIAQYLSAAIAQRERALVYNVRHIGEKGVGEARGNGNYRDRTGNLRASVGYMLLHDGKAVGELGFGKRVGQTLQLHLLFRGARAIASYLGLIAQLGQPGGHRLYCRELRDWLGCYYRGGRVESVLLGDAQWLQCALELQVYDFPTEGLHATGYALGDEGGGCY